MPEYPSILFVDICFRSDSSDGITIGKLVDHFPKDKLFLLSHHAEKADMDLFHERFSFSPSEYKSLTGYKATAFAVAQNRSQNQQTLKGRLVAMAARIFRGIVGGKIVNRHFHVSESLRSWVTKIHPEFIYINPNSLEIIVFAKALSEVVGSKVIIHILDDKADGSFPGISGFFYKRKYQSAFRDIVKQASLRLSICEWMSTHFREKFGLPFHHFHNPVDIDAWARYRSINRIPGSPVKILYSGMVESTAEPILELCRVLERMNKDGMPMQFILYSRFSSQSVINKLKKYPFVIINNYVSQDKLPSVIAQADILFLPLSFRPVFRNLLLSMPTKTAEYMASGVPVLVYAPRESALADYALQHGWANVVSHCDPAMLRRGLEDLISNQELRNDIAAKAINLAEKHHTIQGNKRRFETLLNTS